MKSRESIVFFGTGPVAAKSLNLLARNFKVEAVVTKPKPPHHRGEAPLLAQTKLLGLRTFVPANRAELTALFKTKPLSSSVGVAVDYGIIISRPVIDYFPLGIINSHFSLLPHLRGADPITFAILGGELKTGVSLMLINEKLDEGPLLAQKAIRLDPDVTATELTDQLITLAHTLLKRTLPAYLAGKVKPHPQDKRIKPSYSRRLTKADGVLDWSKPAVRLEREIRAFIEWPKSWTRLGGKDIIITKARALPVNQPGAEPGSSAVVEGTLFIECGKGTLGIEKLKPAGKREMSVRAYLAGLKEPLPTRVG